MAKENNPSPNKFKFNPWLIYFAVAAIFIFISVLSGGSSFQEPNKLSTSKFNELLNNGQVEKVLVFNKTDFILI